jgi:hypothetical protein
MLAFEIFLFIILTSVAVDIFVESTADAVTESSSSALKNGTTVKNETIRLLPNHTAAKTKTLILNHVTSPHVRENTTVKAPVDNS